jgi:peptidoglycan lytic transglycosylase
MFESRPVSGFAVAAALMLGAFGASAAQAADAKPSIPEAVKMHREVGMASFYRAHGRTASGITGQGVMTAAHRRLPFGSRVRVRDVKTGREVVVVITDRGPFQKSRVIDLSREAAKQLGITGRGLARVELTAE